MDDGKPKLLAQVREQIRLRNYSIRTEAVYAAMSSTLEIIHKYHIISAQISAWEKPF